MSKYESSLRTNSISDAMFLIGKACEKLQFAAQYDHQRNCQENNTIDYALKFMQLAYEELEKNLLDLPVEDI